MRRRAELVQRSCQSCGADFQCPDYRVTRGWGKYCSIECRHAGHSAAMTQDVALRFWSKVDRTDPDGCWLWLAGQRGSNDYGGFWIGGKTRPAHVVSWMFANGTVPNGLLVLHQCDVPLCVRPDHLFLGTDADNAADRVRKGRQSRGAKHSACILPNRPRGERHHAAKMSSEQVAELHVLRAAGWSQRRLAARYGVSQATIQRILAGKSRASG